MEKEVAAKEYALKNKKKQGKGKKDTPSQPSGGNPPGPSLIEVDDDCWSIPSEDEAVVAGTGKKASKKNPDDDAAKAARKAEQDYEKGVFVESSGVSAFLFRFYNSMTGKNGIFLPQSEMTHLLVEFGCCHADITCLVLHCT